MKSNQEKIIKDTEDYTNADRVTLEAVVRQQKARTRYGLRVIDEKSF